MIGVCLFWAQQNMDSSPETMFLHSCFEASQDPFLKVTDKNANISKNKYQDNTNTSQINLFLESNFMPQSHN